MIAIEIMELFSLLESNIPHEVEDIKHKFHEHFNLVREPWLLNGMYDYYMSTGSQRAVEVIVAVREPHDKFLFDKLGEGLKSANRLQALTLLGHVVKRQPTWLIKITNHYILKELLKILKTENEIITITSALLVLNVLLTVIPAFIAAYLSDIFEGFSRLAAWNTSQKNRVPEIHLFHLQISLYVLFVQLYSMYPCSFISFLMQQYSLPDHHLVFTHTIKPMVETMRMHPSLIISSKTEETSIKRWKKMEQHDVVMECTRYTLLENGDKNYQNPSTWTNSGSNLPSALEVLKSCYKEATGDFRSVTSVVDNDLWSPVEICGELLKDNVKSVPTTPNLQNYYKTTSFNLNEHSPPEAAVEATPETTPIRDALYQKSRLPSNSTVVRALNTFGLETISRRSSSTPNSQPSSPLKKEGFNFPSEDIHSQAIARRMDRMIMERNQTAELSKDENNLRTESKPIAAQIQSTNNPEIIQTGDEDIIECDQQSNGSPCQTHEGGLHMPDSNSFKEFVISLRTRKRYNSQCTPEKSSSIGFSTNNSPKKVPEFSSLSVRRANSCPEIKKTNASSISSGTSPLQEEAEEDHGDCGNVSNGHINESSKNNAKNDNHVTQTQTVFTQTEHILPYEHLFYSIFPEYNDSYSSNVKGQQNSLSSQEDESLCVIEKYVRTSSIVLNHCRTAKSNDDVQLLKEQISLLTLQLQFERNRREVHAERNRRLLGKSRSSRALDEHNSALKDQVLMLQSELEELKLGFDLSRNKSLKEIRDLKESVSLLETECSKLQVETAEAKNHSKTLEQLYNGERDKTAEVTKQLSDTKAELFNIKSELNIVQATADMSKELKNTVANLQLELVMRGELESQQRDVMTHVKTLSCDATNAVLGQESYKHYLNELQDMLSKKSLLLDVSNSRVDSLQQQLNRQKICAQNHSYELELVKEQYNKKLSEIEKECVALKEIQCQFEEMKKENEDTKKKFLEDLPKFSSDMKMIDSNISMSEHDRDYGLQMLSIDIDEDNFDGIRTATTSPK